MHHIVSDGWSIGVMIKEVASLYESFKEGEPGTLEEPRLQYTDYAVWQREQLNEEALEEQLSYWRKQLEGAPSVIDLPSDYGRPAVASYRGAREQVRVGRELTQKLKVMSRGEGVSLYMLLLAALEVVLSREAGQEDVVIGTRVAGRSRSEVEGLIGFFVNVVVMRERVEEEESFIELMGRVKQTALSAFQHQALPFEWLVKELRPDRTLSHTPLFNVMFVLQNAPLPALQASGLKLEPLEVESGTAKYDLDVTMWESAEGLTGWVEFKTDLYLPGTIRRLMSRFHTLLEAVAADPSTRLSSLELLSDAERHQVLFEFNDTSLDYPRDVLIQEMFEEQVRLTPDAVALSEGGQQVSYNELNLRANRLAHYLMRQGVGPEVMVGVMLEGSIATVVSLMAIIKAGGAYVPLDAAYPDEHLRRIVEQSGLGIVITNEGLKERVREGVSKTIEIDREWEQIEERSGANPAVRSEGESLLYVFYTSGSTGEAKGVAVEQRQMVNRLWWMWESYGFQAGEVMMQRTTMNFSVSMWEMLGGLLRGVRTVIAGEEVRGDVEALIEEMWREEVTRVVVVPSLLRALVEGAKGKGEKLKGVRMWSVCGEALEAGLYERFREEIGDARLINQWGSSETNDVSHHECAREVREELEGEGGSGRRSIPVGRAITNTAVYVVEGGQRVAGIGQRGEAYVRQEGEARGYIRGAEMTAEKMVPDWISGKRGGRLVRMGDVVRRRGDGELVWDGRRDRQVKVRGMRVEVKGVEAELRGHEKVKEAAVEVEEAGAGEKRLVGYVELREGAEGSGEELRRYLRDRVAEQGVPGEVVVIERMPMTGNGKIDRRRLGEARQVSSSVELRFTAPRSPVEEVLAGIWSEVLGVERIGVNDGFFDLGGHSLLATHLMARVREAFQIALPLRGLFESPTVAGLASAIAQYKDREEGYKDSVALLPQIAPHPEDRHQPFALTDIQQAYWVGRSGAFDLGNVAAHSYMELEADSLDLERVNLALQRLVARHDMLQTIVRSDGRQQILEQLPRYDVKVNDLRGSDAQSVAAELEAMREQLSHQMLPSDQWPLFDIRASLLPGGRTRLHISFDLLISDAWSWQVLGREFFKMYQDPEQEIAPIDLSFRDYVQAEIAMQDSEIYRHSLAYWRGRLQSLPPAPELPLVQAPGSIPHPKFVRRSATLEPERWRRLKSAATRAGLTPSGVLLAAFAEILTAWSKSPCFTINLTLFNRLPIHPQVNELVGDFTSLVLLAVDNSAPEAFEVRARRLQESLWDDLDHRFVSGIRILREMARLKGGQPTPMPVVFTSTLNLDHSSQADSSPRIPAEIVYSISQTPQVWLDHQVHEHGGALVFNWDAVEGLFPDGMLQDMFDAYCRLLDRLASDEEAWREGAARVMPVAQLEQRSAINSTQAPVSEGLLQTSFIRQVEERPHQSAVIAPGRTLTYEELYRRSLRVAQRLREMGVKPNTLVAVVMEKGWEQVVAVLGILQAGAAYLPIDAGLPKSRLWYLLEHARARFALTQSWLDQRLEWPDGIERFPIDTQGLAGIDDSPLEPAQTQDDLAYVIYTSGSTGLPKGVMIDHRGAVNTVEDINRRFRIGPEDRVLALSSLSFDLSVYDIFGVLASGGTIVFPEAWATRDPAHWADLIIRERVSVWNSVPALMKILAEYLSDKGERLPRTLRLVMMSGDWIPVSLPGQIKSLADELQVISLGGATEASIWSIIHPIDEVPPEAKSVPYGRPMANQTFHVLDDALEPRPVWVPGHLYIGGIGVALGYWGDEEKTRASFITHPRTGERLYRTGDLGRYLPDGNIEFLGREDSQVKVQGYRIELGEIEAALSDHPAVREAVIAAVGERDNRRLAAYVVPEPGSAIVVSDLRAFLKERLPDYMEPSFFVMLDALPLSSNGKVDRKALPELPQRQAESHRRSATTEPSSLPRITELVSAFLEIAEVDPQANLLEMGASSVDMIRIANLLEKEIGFRPNIDEFYREPTLIGLATAHERRQLDNRPAAPESKESRLSHDGATTSFSLVVDPYEREEFKKKRPGLRRDGKQRGGIDLLATEPDDLLIKKYAERRSHREFLQGAIPFSQFGKFIGSLRQVFLDGEAKYLYPSAGGIYPVQAYLHVKRGRVEGVGAGVYYYHPANNRLVSLSDEGDLPAALHEPFINRPVFESAAFSIFLIAQLNAVGPLYGKHSLQFATLEAGYMSQLLMTHAPSCGIGLCPIGVLNFDLVEHLFALDESHVLVHSLVGGRVGDGEQRAWSSFQEAYQPAGAAAEDREEIEL